MDESWRMKMGLSVDPFFSIARKSMDARIDAEDFADVFGGPPRSVLTRKFSGDFSRSDCFYDEIFRPPGNFSGGSLPSSKSHGRNLPAFRIPSGGEGFYDGVFGGRGGSVKEGSKKQSSTAKSRSNSSSMLSSEEVSPHNPPPAAASGDDSGFSSFTSRLRPLNVPSRSHKRESKKQSFSAFPTAKDSFSGQNNTPEKTDFYYRKPHFGGSRRASPETISLDPNSFRRMDDYGPSSPASSPVSSFICEEEENTDAKQRTNRDCFVEDVVVEDEEDEEEEMSSYVIEINSDRFDRYREEGGGGGGNSDSNDMDEAIAWAKERSQRPEAKQTEEDVIDSRRSEEEPKSEEEMEMEMKDEEIRIWLTGKETNIRLLLSTLHHVLWSNSNWDAIPLANLRDGSQVKKAYQKARLCLHPDKLQQRGGTSPIQKSVASRVFAILQEAWAVYVTNEGLSS
ncbi:Chaperone J-domain superfamily [Arabidopsis thaliana x Arabidopsis arenosa]|uniref:Chaperone J-domain superfamily n=1 Tax=Arabidopsis thaliana x Arabidopsis arenosa TaxID=1240361 RepID=A0A8T2C577_9BRAS|nr:Chaperone J-domain superfamily [Arabidopsis thaliana x Arabidopsis arenosa]